MTCCCRVYVIFTSLLLVFVSCVGRRGADDSDANVSEGSPYILPSRSSIEARTMSLRHLHHLDCRRTCHLFLQNAETRFAHVNFTCTFLLVSAMLAGTSASIFQIPLMCVLYTEMLKAGLCIRRNMKRLPERQTRSEKERQPSRPSRPMDMRDGESLSRPINAITFLEPPWPAAY